MNRFGRPLGFERQEGTGRQLLSTAIWSIVGESIARGLTFISLVWVARTLDPEGYGEFGLVRTTIAMLAGVGGMGLGLTANRFVAQFRDKDRLHSGKVVGLSYLVAGAAGLVVGAAVFVAAPYLSSKLLGSAELEGPFRLVAPLLLASAISGAQAGILQGLQAYRILAGANMAQGLAGAVLIAMGAWIAGVTGAVAGLLLQALLCTGLFHLVVVLELRRHDVPFVWSGLRAVSPILWAFSVPLVLTSVAVAPFKWLNETLLARQVGFSDLGVFHAALAISNTAVAVVSTLNAPLISALARWPALSASAMGQRLNLYGSWYAFLAVAAPLLMFPTIPSLVFGSEYADVRFEATSQVLVLYSGLLLYYQGIIRLVTLNGSMWFVFATNLVEGVVLAVSFYFLKNRGALGLSMAYLLSYAVRIGVSVPFLLRSRILTQAMLLDRTFLVSLLLVSAVVLVRVVGWAG